MNDMYVLVAWAESRYTSRFHQERLWWSTSGRLRPSALSFWGGECCLAAVVQSVAMDMRVSLDQPKHFLIAACASGWMLLALLGLGAESRCPASVVSQGPQ